MTKPLDTPILFIVFNRLDTASVTLAAIRKAKPRKLFIAADGPRLDITGERENCQEVRDYLLKNIDWDCRVETLFQIKNLGIQKALKEALDWFFATNKNGIILEHDCLPNDSFFLFCEKLLEKYKDNEQIMHISGNFFQPEKVGQSDYYFSRIPHIWGWATWRRAWQKYDLEMATYHDFLKNQTLKKYFKSDRDKITWKQLFNQVYHHKSATWDFQWTYALFRNGGLAITPNRNLVKNIGFGYLAENCRDEKNKFSNLPTTELNFPLRHPTGFVANQAADEYTTRHNFAFGWLKYILARLGLFDLIQYFYQKIK
ncbi:MAG: hypothetical protein WC456_02020 [Patescibacteria group bacterium]